MEISTHYLEVPIPRLLTVSVGGLPPTEVSSDSTMACNNAASQQSGQSFGV